MDLLQTMYGGGAGGDDMTDEQLDAANQAAVAKHTAFLNQMSADRRANAGILVPPPDAGYLGVGAGNLAPSKYPVSEFLGNMPQPTNDPLASLAPGAGPETGPRTLGPQPSPGYFPMVPPIGGGMHQVKIFDGFHGDDGLGPMTSDPTYGPSIPAAPGAGWGTNAHPSDQEYANRAGQALVPHVWTEGDLDPTRVLGVNGFKFSPDTQGYTAASPNLPLFAAAQAGAKQDNLLNQMFLQHQNDTQHMLAQQMFQGQQGDLNRKNQIDMANIAAGKSDHTKLNDVATNPAAPLTERNTSIDEGERKGLYAPERAAEMRTQAIVDQANKIDPNKGAKFWSYVQQNYDPQRMRKDSLIRAVQNEGLTAPQVSQFSDPITNGSMGGTMYRAILRDILGVEDDSETQRARQFAGGLLGR